MREKIEKLQQIANQVELSELKALQEAVDKTRETYRESPTIHHGKDRDYAQGGLEKAVKRLFEKYFPAEKTFKNRFEVLKYLKTNGYKISRGKFYKDCPKRGGGLLKVNNDGTVPVSAVDKYILRAELEKPAGAGGEIDEDFRRKARAEADHRETHVKISRLKLEEMKGRLVSKEEVKTLLVDRIREFRQALLSQGRRLSLRCANKSAEEIQAIIEEDNRAMMEAYSRENPITGILNIEEEAVHV